MIPSLETVIEIIALVVVLFHKRILVALGFGPKRLRDLIGILSVGVFLLIVAYLRTHSVLSDHKELFAAGLILGVPAGILTATNMLKNIKDNVLYPRKSFGFYSTSGLGAAAGVGAFYFGYVTDFLSFAAGMSLTILTLLMFYIIRYEKRFGPVSLNRV